MKIIIVGPAHPFRGGIAHFNHLLGTHLAKSHNVEIITFRRQYPKLVFPGKSQIEPESTTPDIKITQLIDSINPLNWLKVSKKISRLKPDLLIFKYWLPFFGPCFGTIAKYVKTYSKTKVLFICDNVIPHERRPGDIRLTKYAFKYVDYFVVQSNSVRKDLLSLVPDAKHLITPHPIYENFGDPIEKIEAREKLNIQSDKVILFFGYIRKYKGLKVLLEALNIIIKKTTTPPFLIVAGEFYDDQSQYKNLIEELNIENYVKFFSDYIPNEQVTIFFSAADVVVLPYISATQSGITQISYNFNKPVIATNVGGLSEVVKDGITGFVVPSNDPEKLANAIIKYFEDNLEKYFSENIKIEKRKYTWDYFIQSIEDLVR